MAHDKHLAQAWQGMQRDGAGARRCAYCGLALHDPWIVRRDPDALPEPDNLLAVCWYHGPRKGHAPDSAYRFDNGIPTVTPWDPL